MDRMPIYIKIEHYEDVLDLVNLIKDKIKASKNTLSRIHELKVQEDNKLESWRLALMDVEKKINNVDSKLSEP